MKTLRCENVCLSDYQTSDEVVADAFPAHRELYNRHRLHSALGCLAPAEFERR